MLCRMLRAARRSLRIALVAGVLLGCVSCALPGRIPQPEVNAQQLVGHPIRVTTLDGRVLEFELTAVTEDGLVGVSQQVPFDEIALLERQYLTILWRKVFLVTGVVAATLAVLVIVVGAGIARSM